ncbi:TVP38/TMEM64 family protein [Gracilimonas mengyeensis]|uniref:Membrane protein DedA, SNARE-associated domain n=1 Tax=Gracilimonas mengyeensis TaxID=1302730 RepID=A0A521DRK2_9BACT|nr:VTT domain-containing protein [Gracilimonas mengyeensis]SMO74344.1 membrane protein DedA, SNARE-associated domain [Gracilimonas mengyeensis]
MKDLAKLILVLATAFASTFLIANLTGVLTIEQSKLWLQSAQDLSPLLVGSLVILLLFSDLFVAVPTLTITILSGYFLGFPYGGISAIAGMFLAGIAGYAISSRYGDVLFSFIVRDEQRRIEAKETFQQYGFVMILMSRAVPIFPEVSACLAGITGMSFSRFLTAWLLSSVPYALIASYAGSVSSLDNPMPAIYTTIGLTAVLWGSWFVFRRYHQTQQA